MIAEPCKGTGRVASPRVLQWVTVLRVRCEISDYLDLYACTGCRGCLRATADVAVVMVPERLSWECGVGLQVLVDRLKTVYGAYATPYEVASELLGNYVVQVHNAELLPLIAPVHSMDDIERIAQAVDSRIRLRLDRRPHGTFVSAAETDLARAERTNYDAVWMRDSLWAYLALQARKNGEDASPVLLTQLDYLASQRQRLLDGISDPDSINSPSVAAAMRAVHIRFDPTSPVFADVLVDGLPQEWAHKQNDALGLLLDTACRAVLDYELPLAALVERGRLEALILLVQYLIAVDFVTMEDSGSWEEETRRNTSSIGLVVSGLERILLMAAEHRSVADALFDVIEQDVIAASIERGYAAIRAGLAAGGESPWYDEHDFRYRKADAALLNLVYPAQLAQLTLAEKSAVVRTVATLAGAYGVRRYWGDHYQSGNFWFNNIKTDTSRESHEQRRRLFIKGTEAEWFFDSWLALSYLMLAADSHESRHLAEAARYTNRSLGQFTPRSEVQEMLAGDGLAVPGFVLPESYNRLLVDDVEYVLPSPIAPLNWAGASLALLLDKYRTTLREWRS